jgi:type VI secretion system secreted protein VgrG
MSSSSPKLTLSQEDRLLKIKTSLGDTDLVLESFSGSEELSQPFAFQVTLLSSDESIDIQSLLRTPSTITAIQKDNSERYYNGVFKSLSQSKEGEGTGGEATNRGKGGMSNPDEALTVYQGVFVPTVHFLSQDSDCKIFQNQSVTDIVTKVLQDKGVSDFQFRTQGTYPPREYCVQYRESSLDFISRLLEEEGIFYFFEHTDSKHTMVFADKSSMMPVCPGQPSAQYSLGQGGWVGPGEEGVATLERSESAHTGQAALQDYNFTTPNTNLMSTLPGENEEHYDYPGEYGTLSEGDRYVRLRLEEKEAQQFTVSGTSRCRAFRAGVNFKLTNHFRQDTNQDYFLTSVQHDCSDTTYRQNQDKGHGYKNTFKAIPKSVPYRPPRKTKRPTVQGLQSAVVVGKAGEEIWTDQYGRVKVQFFWDRVGQKNEDSSCWVRVSQIWAGKNWGWMSIPRIGQEVLVDFLEGDPDKPIIVGRVYNADQMPPWTLPDNQTQSGILTRSTTGGSSDTANYLQFEDKSGSEQINIWAQKDMNTTVENNDTQTVQQDRTINVNGKHTETVVGDTSVTITQGNHSTTVQSGNQTISINQGNQDTTLDMGNQSTTLSMGNQSTTASVGSISFTATQSITLTVGANSITIDQTGVTISGIMISISGSAMTTVTGSAMLQLSGGIIMIG